MQVSTTGGIARTIVFAPRIDELLRKHRGDGLFRLDHDTVGIGDPHLIDAIMASRPANDFERPTFKPLQGKSISRPESTGLMRAVGQDVRIALKKTDERPVDLSGEWPHVGHVYLRDLIFPGDPMRLLALMDRRLEWTTALTRAVVTAGSALPGWPSPDAPISNLGKIAAEARGYHAKFRAMGLYRRASAPVCFTVSQLVASAIWLGAPFDDQWSNRDIIHETLRLLPVSWNLLRVASPEFPALDARIGPKDDVLMFPLLSHRDPALWDDPDEFRPERWATLDPDHQLGYLPFGHLSERCWGRHMVLPLAERLLDLVREGGYRVDPAQAEAKVPLAGLFGVTKVKVTR
ncbi:Cytochrome P450 [Amycolatopsis xylanica]|uniref:Cytochrome P450 n=1 Tax=Amycolatopsis xylanica TaxID=589385 RepID=A0A1H3K7H5_9PSEU|nr:cytochrome P450 [Amycolatopsis xylanica]SDY48146.1 Cytochrome P450 [Amycolatopsis xylanica]